MLRRPPRSPLFPYTTLSRSQLRPAAATKNRAVVGEAAAGIVKRGCAPPAPRGLPGLRPLDVDAHRPFTPRHRSEEHTSELQSRQYLVCRLLLAHNIPILILT